MSDSCKDPSDNRPKMVDWYSPKQLLNTARNVTLSEMLGVQIDTRRLQAAESEDADCVIDYASEIGERDEPFTFCYMADTGDGWNATYSMAYLLTAPEVSYLKESGSTETIRRADCVILGGDEVYPIASKDFYEKRLTSPFKKAAEDVEERSKAEIPRKDIYMIPGNHDWYDSLGAFSRMYLARRSDGELKTKELGQFDTRQVRSYFVLKLPHDWEIWAVDQQLCEYLDTPQEDFFASHARTISAKTRVILCSAAPLVVYGEKLDPEESQLPDALGRIAQLAHDRGARVKVQLAGDIHNYQRYEIFADPKPGAGGEAAVDDYKRYQIVSGGGGAFLHPNHGFPGADQVETERCDPGSKAPEEGQITPKMLYPDRATSEKLSCEILKFPILHPFMSALIGLLYLFFFWEDGVSKLISVDQGDPRSEVFKLASANQGEPASGVYELIPVDKRSDTYKLISADQGELTSGDYKWISVDKFPGVYRLISGDKKPRVYRLSSVDKEPDTYKLTTVKKGESTRKLWTFPIVYTKTSIIMVLVAAGCVIFAGKKKWAGGMHAVAHGAAAFGCWWLGEILTTWWLGEGHTTWWMGDPAVLETLGGIYLSRILTFVLATAAGGLVFGLYLYLSLKCLKTHHNEVFSAFPSPHYKHFLHCTVKEDGVFVRVIGVEKTASDYSNRPVSTHLVEEFSIEKD